CGCAHLRRMETSAFRNAQLLGCGRLAESAERADREIRPTEVWNGEIMRRITGNPLLRGMPRRGLKQTVKHHETGRRVYVKNHEGPSFYECPHLAFWTPEEFDEVNALLEKSNQPFKRKCVKGTDPRLHVPRKRTCFPGQHACCWYCGRQYVWGGN